jgi:hypothetical protein
MAALTRTSECPFMYLVSTAGTRAKKVEKANLSRGAKREISNTTRHADNTFHTRL